MGDMVWDGSRGYGSSGDRDKLKENDMSGDHDKHYWETKEESYMDRKLVNVGELEQRVKRLEQGTTTTVLPNTDEADEFVRKELIRAYECMDDRDKPMLEYVIRMFSNPDQWKEFWEENDLDHTYVIGEKI
ncbi:MAG: hypothetical protein K0U78_04575 [Actinomycetia bacterium]|nr:hypothetical protein [Actinomycetes bacterium]